MKRSIVRAFRRILICTATLGALILALPASAFGQCRPPVNATNTAAWFEDSEHALALAAPDGFALGLARITLGDGARNYLPIAAGLIGGVRLSLPRQARLVTMGDEINDIALAVNDSAVIHSSLFSVSAAGFSLLGSALALGPGGQVFVALLEETVPDYSASPISLARPSYRLRILRKDSYEAAPVEIGTAAVEHIPASVNSPYFLAEQPLALAVDGAGTPIVLTRDGDLVTFGAAGARVEQVVDSLLPPILPSDRQLLDALRAVSDGVGGVVFWAMRHGRAAYRFEASATGWSGGEIKIGVPLSWLGGLAVAGPAQAVILNDRELARLDCVGVQCSYEAITNYGAPALTCYEVLDARADPPQVLVKAIDDVNTGPVYLTLWQKGDAGWQAQELGELSGKFVEQYRGPDDLGPRWCAAVGARGGAFVGAFICALLWWRRCRSPARSV